MARLTDILPFVKVEWSSDIEVPSHHWTSRGISLSNTDAARVLPLKCFDGPCCVGGWFVVDAPMPKTASIQRHPRILSPAWPRPGDGTEGDGPAFDWAALVPRIVHPVKVAIVETLLWIGHPLSATELRDLFDEPEYCYLSIVSYHVGKLVEFGALRETGSRQVRGATETFYFFPAPS